MITCSWVRESHTSDTSSSNLSTVLHNSELNRGRTSVRPDGADGNDAGSVGESLEAISVLNVYGGAGEDALSVPLLLNLELDALLAKSRVDLGLGLMKGSHINTLLPNDKNTCLRG
jgi:hypothetical protein